MNNLWNAQEAASYGDDLLGLRVYTSRLLGREPELVLHGGGNTSVKIRERTFFGVEEEILYVKGSGWDLATIEKQGFAPIRMAALLKLAALERLTDADMVLQMRAAMTDPSAPDGSIEAILHAVLPFTFVDHTHANAILALTNNETGKMRVKEVFGGRVLSVPYIMPGFALARRVYEMTRAVDFTKLEGVVLLNHGLFTFSNDARESYERTIALVTEAEDYLHAQMPDFRPATAAPTENLVGLARLRSAVSGARGRAMLARVDASPEACGFTSLENVASIASRGPVTPDHVLRTKRVPLTVREEAIADAVEDYAGGYREYFNQSSSRDMQMLDPAPRWAVWPGWGTVAFGDQLKGLNVVEDIVRTTIRTIQMGEQLGGWIPLSPTAIFAIEYWDLEQAKLKKAPPLKPFAGKVALVTGAAAGIGRACLEGLHEAGAAVVGVDLNPEIEELNEADKVGVVGNLTDDHSVKTTVDDVVRRFGGLDILVSNAGIFTAGAYIEHLEMDNWNKSMAVNLTSHQRLLHHCVPYLRHGVDPTAIFIGSRNVHAPGAGAASYSVAKAGLTQLMRVAALELAPENVRVNIIHPDAVFDTKLWTPAVLARSAERYHMTVEEYKTRNLLQTEIKSADVAAMVVAMAGPAFAKTTGAQIPVDGGNDRVI